MGELHFGIIVDRMMREYKVEANVASLRWRTGGDHSKSSEAEGNTSARQVAASVWATQIRLELSRQHGIRIRE